MVALVPETQISKTSRYKQINARLENRSESSTTNNSTDAIGWDASHQGEEANKAANMEKESATNQMTDYRQQTNGEGPLAPDSSPVR